MEEESFLWAVNRFYVEESMNASTKKVIWFGLAILAFGCVAAVRAQEKNEALGSGSLTALTEEVRQLRLAVEESIRSQTQTQALGVYLSAQQSRIVQVASRLDAVRRDVEAASDRSQAMATRMANIEDMLSRVTEPTERAALESENRQISRDQKRFSLQEQQARNRETELSQSLQIENDRWGDLIARLEQMIKK
jgi:predicted  nucleic acid-binding Zn-ribbon protein